MNRQNILRQLDEFQRLGIGEQIDYRKFYLYSIITHSTAIEGSTVTEIENQLLFDEGITSAKRTLQEQQMNLDLKTAYEHAFKLTESHTDFSTQMLCQLSADVMKNTGAAYNTISGTFDASKGDLRLVNVTAGFGGRSYLAWQKVPDALAGFCDWLNSERHALKADDAIAAYTLSFEAHRRLVNIHPWVDGNGRMSRLVMNMLQVEARQLPTIVHKEHKEQYIQSLIEAAETETDEPFCEFMFDELNFFLTQNIDNYRKSIEDNSQKSSQKTPKSSQKTPKSSQKSSKGSQKSSQKILQMLADDGALTTQQVADRLQLSRRAVAKHIQKLQEQGKLKRVGPDKGGHWEVTKS